MKSNNQEKKHVLIVGAGIIGSGIALELSDKYDVLILDRGDSPGQSGATRSTFSWINSVYKKPFDYHTLNRISTLLWPAFAQKLGKNAIGFHQRGLYHWSTQAEVEPLRKIVAASQTNGYPIKEVKRADEPYLKQCTTPIYYSPEDAIVDAQKVCKRCVELAVKNGAKYVKDVEVVGLVKEGDRVIGARTKDNHFYASDICIVAAGTGSQKILKTIGVDLPLKPSASSHSKTKPLDFELLSNTSLALKRCNGERYHLKQDLDGSIRMGRGVSNQKIKWNQRQEWAEDLRDEWAKDFPILKNMKVKCTLEGKRVKSKDGLPVVGFMDSAKSVYGCVTHSGVTLIPLLKTWVRAELEGAVIEALQPFRISRFEHMHAKL